MLQSERSRAVAVSRRLYTSHLRSMWLAIYQRQISDQATRPPVYVAWVRTDAQPTDLTLLPGSADAIVRATYTSTTGQVSVWDDQYQLVRPSHGWRIDTWAADCVSGCP